MFLQRNECYYLNWHTFGRNSKSTSIPGQLGVHSDRYISFEKTFPSLTPIPTLILNWQNPNTLEIQLSPFCLWTSKLLSVVERFDIKYIAGNLKWAFSYAQKLRAYLVRASLGLTFSLQRWFPCPLFSSQVSYSTSSLTLIIYSETSNCQGAVQVGLLPTTVKEIASPPHPS